MMTLPSDPVLVLGAPELDQRNPVGLRNSLDVLGMRGVSVPNPDNLEADISELREREDVYVWPGRSDHWMRGIERLFPKVRILDGELLSQYGTVFDLVRFVGEVGAQARFRVAMAKSYPVGVVPPKVGYDFLEGFALERLGERLRGPIEAIPTPFPTWNAACRMWGGQIGLAHGWYVLIGGGTGMGKTFTAMEMATHTQRQRLPAAIHSLEMDWDTLALRALAQLTGLPIYELEPGSGHNPETFAKAEREAQKIHDEGGHLLMNRRPMRGLQDILDSMLFYWETYGVRWHVVDYLQLAWIKNARDQLFQITETSHAVQEFTLRYQLVTVGVSQLNRETSTNRTERPTKEGMAGGSALENDSVQTVLLDHSRVNRHEKGWDSWLLLDKNRHGPLKDIPIAFSSRDLSVRERIPTQAELDAPAAAPRGRRKS